MNKRHFRSILCLSLSLSLISALGVQVADAKQIGSVKEAEKLALKKVPSAQVIEAEKDTDNGAVVYEISLLKSSKEYSLKYRASDSKLMEYGWELSHSLSNQSYVTTGGKTLAKSKIRTKAKKKVPGGKIKSVRLTIDDGTSEYKVTLTKGSKKYKLAYNAKNGKLLEYEWELTTSSKSSSYIGKSKAQQIAKQKAPGASVVKCEFDKDDGAAVYEIELRKGTIEYDVTIDAKTGAVLEFESDVDD